MKKLITSLTLIGITLTLLYAADPAKTPQLSKAGHWKAYDAALKKGLPKTAITHLEPIIKETLAQKQYDEAIKAIGKKISLEGNIQGNKPQEKIRRLEAEIAKAPKEMVPVMDAILANWYWHYFQQNRWRFIQRTQTGAAAGKDFETWDLQRIFTEIDKQFTKALAGKTVLQKTPVADYNELLQKGTQPDSFRPTMYDFLVHNALQFYSTGEQAGSKAQDAFELSANSPVFDSTAKFMTWEIKTTDTESRTVRALQLYQSLLHFHENDKDQSAYIDADLGRINFGKNKGFGEEKSERYRSALKGLINVWADHRISARARFHLAQSLDQEGDKVQAHKIAIQGRNAFPNTPGGAMCHNLVNQIEAKSSQVTIERIWNDPQSEITIKYRNVNQIHFRVVAENWEDAMKRKRGNPQWLDQNEKKDLLRKNREIIKQWSVKLPPTTDFHEAVKTIKPPKGIPAGFYYLISSHNQNFSAANNVCYYTDFWASDLSIVMRTRSGNGLVEGFVLNARSGEPVANVKVRAWTRDRNVRREVAPTTSDASGRFKFPAINRGYLILAGKGNQQLSTANDYYNSNRVNNPRPYDRTIFFTDRSIYRPGQTVEFKGLCIHVDQHGDNYRTLPNSFVTVQFRDRNGKEISRQQHRANDHGSFSGKFTAPRDRVLGRMSLQVTTGPRGSASVNVEEYKRPKFQVKIEAPEIAAKLSGEVALIGKATGYTGAAINDAKVKWRVVREVRYPVWWGWHYWWRPAPQGKTQEIAHGTATTKANGAFDVKFTAKPDLSVALKGEPIFRYTIYADVTDTTGETRSDNHSINLGYTALKASVSAADWQAEGKDVAVNISTTSLDGIGQKAEGTLKLYTLKQPAQVQRASLQNRRYVMPIRRGRFAPEFMPAPDTSNVNSWELGNVVAQKAFNTDESGQANFNFPLKEGAYRAILETQDRFGKKVTARLPIQVVNPKAAKLAIRVPHLLKSPTWTVEPGNEFMALWGSGYGDARAFIEVEHRRKVLQSFWTERGLTQFALKQAVNEAMRGGFTVHVTMVRENRAYLTSKKINVPWTNKNLTVKWEHFTDKLKPGQKEKWTAVISGSGAQKAVAEMTAVLYDESLDQYKPHQWQTAMNVFRQDYARLNQRFANQSKGSQHLQGQWNRPNYKNTGMSYRTFPREIAANLSGYGYFGARNQRMFSRGRGGPEVMEMAEAQAGGAPRMAMRANKAMAAPPGALMAAMADADDGVLEESGERRATNTAEGENSATGPDLSQVTARKNFKETAFFMPHLVSNEEGEVRLEFSMPEALTKWKFMGFTHDNELRSGFLSGSAVTAKDIMVQPNPPRFLREGDQLEFTVKVTNTTEKEQTGNVRLSFADALTEDNVDDLLGNVDLKKPFAVPAKQSHTYSWRVSVPDGLGFLTYKATGGTDKVTDGVQAMLPVLSRRIFVTESLPLPIRGAKTKAFNFKKLVDSAKSDSIKHERFTVQMVSNPNWYAVMALPYLMESPHPSTMSTFTRLYANGLAHHIAGSDPRIRQVFDKWRDTPALDSPLEKNQDLKAVMLEETPWLRQAKNESQARRNVGILFDDKRLDSETQNAQRRLREMQFADGAWPWMPGGRASDYITLYITTGFGRMRAMNVEVDINMAVKAVNRLDGWIDKTYRRIQQHGNLNNNNLSSMIAQYLYCRSFFLKDRPVAKQHLEAINYFLGQAVKKEKDGTQYFLRLSRMNQAQVAIAMNRFGRVEQNANYNQLAKLIIKSIKERSVTNEEMGLFWRDLEYSHWWYRAPIETQAMMIEAFHEVTQDFDALEEAKVWLIKQKQTQDWKTTKATADACYALLLQGANPLTSEALVEVTVGNTKIEPKNVEAGTGFYEHRFLSTDVKSNYGKIKLTKHDEGVAWGSVHWQYMEDISKVTPHEDTPLKLTKKLFTKVNTPKGPQLKPVTGGLKTGDELVVRLVLRTDRDMEYVHMKDQRGSGTEPVNVLSRYKYQDGLGYYETTRDTASHFYIDYLPKGIYAFEYSVRVQHKGQYQSGIANIQCMYAPEFNSHSESHKLSVN